MSNVLKKLKKKSCLWIEKTHYILTWGWLWECLIILLFTKCVYIVVHMHTQGGTNRVHINTSSIYIGTVPLKKNYSSIMLRSISDL